MRRRELVHVVDFAVGRPAPMERRAVPGSFALFERFARLHCGVRGRGICVWVGARRSRCHIRLDRRRRVTRKPSGGRRIR